MSFRMSDRAVKKLNRRGFFISRNGMPNYLLQPFLFSKSLDRKTRPFSVPLSNFFEEHFSLERGGVRTVMKRKIFVYNSRYNFPPFPYPYPCPSQSSTTPATVLTIPLVKWNFNEVGDKKHLNMNVGDIMISKKSMVDTIINSTVNGEKDLYCLIID